MVGLYQELHLRPCPCPDLRSFVNGGDQCHLCRQYDDGFPVVIDKARQYAQAFGKSRCACDGVFDNRKQALTKFNTHLVEPLLALFYLCLYGGVHGVELTLYARGLLVGFGSTILMLAYIVDLVGHGGKYSNGTRSV